MEANNQGRNLQAVCLLAVPRLQQTACHPRLLEGDFALQWELCPPYDPKILVNPEADVLSEGGDHTTEDAGDCLRKIRYLHDIIQQKCRTLYTRQQCVSVGERMVKCQGHAPFRQYLQKKPVKWGVKAFALCESSCGVLCDFEVYKARLKPVK